MKWEPLAVMALLLAVSVWLVYQPRPDAQPGATLVRMRIGDTKAWVEAVQEETTDQWTFRILQRGADPGDPITEQAFRNVLGDRTVDRIIATGDNAMFRLLNITSWGGVAWVLLGFGAQLVFAARFLVQWIVSEKRQESVVPEAFWWISLAGGAMLYCYFVWRMDLPAVLGQSTGIVIYARNLRLIWKTRRRSSRSQDQPGPDAGKGT